MIICVPALITSHFVNRKIKCWNDPKLKRIAAIKANVGDPVILNYIDNPDYQYFESILDNRILYNCNRCDYKTDELSPLKRHFGRAIKCWTVERKPTIIDPDSNVGVLDSNENHKFVEKKNDLGEAIFECFHCQYTSPVRSRLRRHFNGVRKCWL